jgi:hypothetical protein
LKTSAQHDEAVAKLREQGWTDFPGRPVLGYTKLVHRNYTDAVWVGEFTGEVWKGESMGRAKRYDP